MYRSLHCKNQRKLHASLLKHGFDSHRIEVVWVGECEEYELSIIEQFWISARDTFRNGLNMTFGGEGSVGRRLSEEHKRKIADRMKGKTTSDRQKAVVRQKMTTDNPMKKKEFREKVSRARKGIVFTEEHKRKLYAKVSTKEAREKSRLSKIGKRMGKDNHFAKPVYQFKGGVLMAKYDSAASASRATGIIRANITHCCLGNRKSAGGYTWSYNEKKERTYIA